MKNMKEKEIKNKNNNNQKIKTKTKSDVIDKEKGGKQIKKIQKLK